MHIVLINWATANSSYAQCELPCSTPKSYQNNIPLFPSLTRITPSKSSIGRPAILLRTSTRLYQRRWLVRRIPILHHNGVEQNDRNQLFDIFNAYHIRQSSYHVCHFVKKMKESYYSCTMTMVNFPKSIHMVKLQYVKTCSHDWYHHACQPLVNLPMNFTLASNIWLCLFRW